MRKTAIVILCLFFSGCATGATLVKKSVLVSHGDTKERVLSIIGQPGDRQFNGEDEVWQYCKTDFTGLSHDKFVMVWFYQGQVTGVSTYNNNEFGTCSSFFKTIKWEDAPDRTVEFRTR